MTQISDEEMVRKRNGISLHPKWLDQKVPYRRTEGSASSAVQLDMQLSYTRGEIQAVLDQLRQHSPLPLMTLLLKAIFLKDTVL